MRRNVCRKVAGLALGLVVLSGCAMEFKQDERTADAEKVHCHTARGDLRVLQAEKANVAEQIAMGVLTIYPAAAVMGLLSGTEDTKFQVATGEYNDAIDKKIAQIKSTCGL